MAAYHPTPFEATVVAAGGTKDSLNAGYVHNASLLHFGTNMGTHTHTHTHTTHTHHTHTHTHTQHTHTHTTHTTHTQHTQHTHTHNTHTQHTHTQHTHTQHTHNTHTHTQLLQVFKLIAIFVYRFTVVLVSVVSVIHCQPVWRCASSEQSTPSICTTGSTGNLTTIE